MAYFALCGPERIPMTLVEGAVEDEPERMNALAALAEVSLAKHDPFEDGTPAMTVHRLVQAVARARSDANGSGQDAVGRLIARLVAIYPEESYHNPALWPLCAQLTPHLLARRDASLGDAPIFAGWPALLHSAGLYFQRRAAYSQAVPLFRDALATREKMLGPEHPDTATTLDNLARLFQAQGDLAGARPLLERALAIHEKVSGPEHFETANNMSNLARVLRDTGHANEAEPLFHKAIAIGEKSLGRDHSLTQRYASHYARLLVETGRASAGLTFAQSALATHEAASGLKAGHCST
jgi:tetratricopeptide (TPR) repeat protein